MEKIAFPDFSDDGSGDLDVVRDRIAAVFADESAYAAEVEASQRLAREKAGYEPVARALADFVAAVSGTAV